jgi:predicted nucleic acid-binding Zn ribbon protein
MLAQFGYKRCPRCKAGVKKMYGCSHMQCLCGAHWCYYCQKSLNECDGTCEERRLEEEEEDEDSDSDEEPDRQEALANQPPAIQAGPNPGAGNVTALNIPNINDGTTHAGTASNTPAANPPAVYTPTHPPTAPTALPAHPTPMVVNRVVNLDAGGGHRWAEGDYNFGEEPEEEPYSQVWSCQHKFDVFQAATDDGFNHGDYSRMECNRCFEKVQINRKGAPKSVKKRRRLFNGRGEQVSGAMEDSREASQEAVSEENEAHECPMCKIIVCVRCKEKFIEERIV